ncbi:MAG TPA: MauE/DoxX family redox-associated membrane protein [Pyrinomonadaceae bacterium]|nr:MauE/DoxX family redox-associated membrane protein [Pyrinomonadaceae bacterium]
MDLILALLRLALSIIFGVAGITKLMDRRGTREAVVNFGAPASLAPAIALILPIIELLITVGLLFNSTTWWSALLALLTLTVFMVAISVNLAQGRTHDCHCFGQLHSRPLGWPTLIRNILFALAVVVVLWRFEPNAYPAIHTTIAAAFADLNKIIVLLFVVALFSGAAALGIWQRKRKQVASNAAEITGLPLDTPAPEFELESYDGGNRSLKQLLEPGKPLLLLFTNPKCGPCLTLFDEIKDWQQSHGDKLTIALISRGTIKENFVSVAKNGLGEVLLQQKFEVAQLFGANATPSAVVVSPEGVIFSHVAAGADEIRNLLESVLGKPLTNGELASVDADEFHSPTFDTTN